MGIPFEVVRLWWAWEGGGLEGLRRRTVNGTSSGEVFEEEDAPKEEEAGSSDMMREVRTRNTQRERGWGWGWSYWLVLRIIWRLISLLNLQPSQREREGEVKDIFWKKKKNRKKLKSITPCQWVTESKLLTVRSKLCCKVSLYIVASPRRWIDLRTVSILWCGSEPSVW